jgi:predicted flap endonuclease-1-like 5' DNA nuclease
MTTNDTILAALAEFAADLATDLQNLSTKAAGFAQRLQAVETTVQETKPKKASKKAEKAPEPQPEAEAAPALTLEDVRASLAAVVKNGGSAKVRDALADLGVSKLSDLAPERFSELLEAVNA